MASIFTKIVKGEIPCYKIAETDRFLAFLDVNPNAKGHALCIPKKEVDNVFDLDKELYVDLMLFCKTVAEAIKDTISCERVGLSVIGLEVPHAHVHLIPINAMDDMRFIKKVQLEEKEFKAIARAINSSYLEKHTS